MMKRDFLSRKNALYHFIVLLFLYFFLFITYQNYIRNPYAFDFYSDYFRTNLDALSWYFKLGRFVLAVVSYFINFAKHKQMEYYLTVFFMTISLRISIHIFICILLGDDFFSEQVSNIKKGKIGLIKCITIVLATCFLYVNPMYCDWFPFSDAVVFAIGTCFATIASWLVYRTYRNEKRLSFKVLCIAVILVFLAGGCYQPTMEFFIVQSVLALILVEAECFEELSLGRLIIAIIKSFAIYISVALIQLIMIKLINNTGTRIDNQNIIENIVKIFKSMPGLLMSANGTVPGNTLWIVTIILLVYAVLYRGVYGNGQIDAAFILISGLVLIGAVYSPFIIAPVYLALRMCVIIPFIPGGIAFWCLNRKVKTYNQKFELVCNVFVLVIMILIMNTYILRINKISQDQIILNYTDRSNVMEYYEDILEYEEENETITRICFPKDEHGLNAWYVGVFFSHDTNVSGFNTVWSRNNMFRFYTGRIFNEIIIDDNEWNRIKKEKSYFGKRLYFDKETVYIPIQ